jgi:hypothetical protein
MKALTAALTFLALAIPVTAGAQSYSLAPWYVGAGAGQSHNGDRDTVTTVRLGYRFIPEVGIEGGYYDLGEHFGTRARSYGISAVFTGSWDQLDVYGRIGYARTDFGRGDENEGIAGVGLRWNLAPRWGVFVEYQRHDKVEIDSWYAGVDWRF